MNDKSYKIDFEIYIVFIVVIGISVFNAIYSSINISRNQESTSRIMTVDIPSLQRLENMNLLITKSKMYTTNWVYLPNNPDDKERLRVLHNYEYPALKKSIAKLMKEWKEKDDAKTMTKIFNGFENLMVFQKQIMRVLNSFDDYEDAELKFSAEAIVDKNILPECANLSSQLNELINKKKIQAELIHIETRESSRSMMWSVMGIAISIVIVIFIAAIYMSNKIIVPTMRLKNFILQMGKGEIPDINIKPGKNAIGQMIEAVQTLTASLRQTAHFAHEIGYGNLSADFNPASEKDELGNALVQMRASLRDADEANRQRTWISSVGDEINVVLRENSDDIDKLSGNVISVLVQSANALQGAIYLVEDSSDDQNQKIILQGSYAKDGTAIPRTKFDLGEGLVGQCMQDKKLIYLKDIPSKTNIIESGLAKFCPSHVLIIPLKYHDTVYGAVEFASFSGFDEFQIEFIESIGETIGSTIASAKSNTLTKKLLAETRKQAARLTAQEEELRRTNDELYNQSKLLQSSEEELKQSNLEMKKKAVELQQKNEINEQARQALIIKAKELELNSKYKSEFLANMSHELRTPLNSVLILAKLLEENKESNLSVKQIEYAGVIHKSGKDLLDLINEILDLSKIEAGKVELIPEETNISSVCHDLKMLFTEFASDKKINFKIESDETLPESFISDRKRLEQIIRNLLSNAFKFTPVDGDVILSVKRPDRNIKLTNPNLIDRKKVIEFSVKDNGIGIPAEKQALIFEAFQQADGSTNRSYGGTGLGLSISKMLVSMLGGEMQLVSEQGSGSTFYVFLPMEYLDLGNTSVSIQKDGVPLYVREKLRSKFATVDDRQTLKKNDKVLLIIEDDVTFANVLLDMAHERNFKAVIATNGTEGLEYAQDYNPSAIIMDMQLPGINGWSVLKKIKEHPKLSHIPVHIMSAMDKQQLGIDLGASAYLRKPVDKRDLDDAFTTIDQNISSDIRHVLLIEDMKIHQEIVQNLLMAHHAYVKVRSVSTIENAWEQIRDNDIDCIVLDLDLGNGQDEGILFLETLKADKNYSSVPVIVFTGAELDQEMERRIRSLATIVDKNEKSLDRLLQETDVFLDNCDDDLRLAENPIFMNEMLKGKRVLLVDDDMRNIYALTNVFEQQDMMIVPASNGKIALEKLNEYKSFDIIILDIMMPVMDGYQVMEEIRKHDEFKQIPIIALTAKAMAHDREKCIQCGANDYIAKPINPEQLLSTMKVWLYK
jgi:signal transduction histidine kinase/CheY-like chemotaxis protein